MTRIKFGKIQDQMELFPSERVVVHYYDQNGALHSGYLSGIVRSGRKKGLYKVWSSTGHCVHTDRIRNIG